MLIYHYHPETNQLMGADMADPSPLEPGTWLIPAHATEAEPPEAAEGKTRHFVDGAWQYQDVPVPEPVPEPVPQPPNPKYVGIEFQGVMCSAMKTDQDGLLAVLVASQLQGTAFKPTRFIFENGSELVLTKTNLPAFIATWMPFRQSFYLPL